MSETKYENNRKSLPFSFNGFSLPTTTAVPDQVLDLLLPYLNGAELKVLLYICRRTFGFKKSHDRISLQQMTEGIETRDGRILDRGTGLSKATVARALNGLENKNIIERIRHSSSRRGAESTSYALKMTNPLSQNVTPPVSEVRHPLSQNETPPVSEMRHPLSQKRDTQQTGIQQTDSIQQQQRKRLSELGFSQASINRLLKLYTQARIQEKLDYLQFLQTQKPGKLTHPRGWLTKAIEDDYDPPEGYIAADTRNQFEQEKQKKQAKAKSQLSRETRARNEALEARKLKTQRILYSLKDEYKTAPDDKQLWRQIISELQGELGSTGASLLAQSSLLSTRNGTATIAAENNFHANWIERRFRDQILSMLKENGRSVEKIELIILSDLGTES